MKKYVALLLAALLMLAIFAGCKDNKDPSDTQPAGTEGSAPAGSNLKLALVVAGTFGDRSFFDSSKEGVDRLVKDLGVKLTTIECNNENFKAQMQNAADKADVVACVGWEFYEIEEVAPQYPNVKWIWVDNETSAPISNLLNIVYKQNEGSFLAGVIAAALSKSGVIGAVGGEDSDTINDFIVGYEQGAKQFNPDVKVIKKYTNSYDDPALGKECALALNDQKADVIFQIASAAGDGVFQAAKERGFYAIGVDSDQKYIDPAVIVCSMKKEVGSSIYDAVKALVGGDASKWGTTWVAGLSDGFVGIGYGDSSMTQQVSDELKTQVEDLAKQIADGKITVNTTR